MPPREISSVRLFLATVVAIVVLWVLSSYGAPLLFHSGSGTSQSPSSSLLTFPTPPPTLQPTWEPTPIPSVRTEPTTAFPSDAPTALPTDSPTAAPSSAAPIVSPTAASTSLPTADAPRSLEPPRVPVDEAKNEVAPDSDCLPAVHRAEFFKHFPNLSTHSALEIAPFASPVLVRTNETMRVRYFDVFNQEELKEISVKYYGPLFTPPVRDAIPYIDYYDHNADLRVVKEKFDMVFSSHNIEHQLDLILHLQLVGDLLEEKGKFFLAAPDYRYCFDHYMPETRVSDALADYWLNVSQTFTHSLNSLLKLRCETTHNDPAKHWAGEHGVQAGVTASCYHTAYKEYIASKGYLDSHKWRLTPTGFRRIIEVTHEMKLHPFTVEKIYCTAKNVLEFYVILAKN